MIHQRILDVAKSNPSATLEGIADEISGASIDLVERVLEEYGDPAEDQQGGQDPEVTPESQDRPNSVDGETPENEGHGQQEDIMEQESEDAVLRKESPMMGETGDGELERESPPERADEEDEEDLDGQRTVDAPDLTEKQLKTLRLIAERPDATQGGLAEQLDVTRATVSRWLSEIPEFEWTERQEFITTMLGERLRLTYFLYKGRAPARPTVENAYQEVHLWVNVTEAPGTGNCARGPPVRAVTGPPVLRSDRSAFQRSNDSRCLHLQPGSDGSSFQ